MPGAWAPTAVAPLAPWHSMRLWRGHPTALLLPQPRLAPPVMMKLAGSLPAPPLLQRMRSCGSGIRLQRVAVSWKNR